MSNNYAPCFIRIDFVVIPYYIELPGLQSALSAKEDLGYGHFRTEKTFNALKKHLEKNISNYGLNNMKDQSLQPSKHPSR